MGALPKTRSPKPIPVHEMFLSDAFIQPKDGAEVLDRLAQNFDYFLVNYLLYYFTGMVILLTLNNAKYAIFCIPLLIGFPVGLYYNTKYKHIEIDKKQYTFTVTFLTRVWLLLFVILGSTTAGLYFLTFTLLLLLTMVIHSAFIDHRRLLLLTNRPSDWISKLDAGIERLERLGSSDAGLQTVEKLEKAYYRVMKCLFKALFIIEDDGEVYNYGISAVMSNIRNEVKDIKTAFRKALD